MAKPQVYLFAHEREGLPGVDYAGTARTCLGVQQRTGRSI